MGSGMPQGGKSIYSESHNMTINPVLLGQRFPKPGAQNFRRNKDTMFILIDRYLFFYER